MEPVEIFRRNVLQEIALGGLKQKDVAKGIGEPPSKLNDFLKGRIGWGEIKRQKLAAYLNVQYSDLYIDHFDRPAFSRIKVQDSKKDDGMIAEKLINELKSLTVENTKLKAEVEQFAFRLSQISI